MLVPFAGSRELQYVCLTGNFDVLPVAQIQDSTGQRIDLVLTVEHPALAGRTSTRRDCFVMHRRRTAA